MEFLQRCRGTNLPHGVHIQVQGHDPTLIDEQEGDLQLSEGSLTTLILEPRIALRERGEKCFVFAVVVRIAVADDYDAVDKVCYPAKTICNLTHNLLEASCCGAQPEMDSCSLSQAFRSVHRHAVPQFGIHVDLPAECFVVEF